MDRMFTGRPLGINGDGNQTRDFIYVLDVADAIIAAMESKENGTYHVSTGTASTVNQLAGHLRNLHTKEMTIEYRPDKAGDIRHSCLSNAKIGRTMGWAPVFSFEQGLQETYRSFSSG